jgi:hypothetical protein
MSNGLAPSSNGLNGCNKEINKEAGSSGLSLNVRGFTTALYVEVLELLVNDGSCSFMRK